MNKTYFKFANMILVLLIAGGCKTGITRDDLSTWKNVSIESINLTFDLPQSVNVEEFKWRKYRTPCDQNGASFKMHKDVPGFLMEYSYGISFMIQRYNRNEWQAYVDSCKNGSPEFMAEPDAPSLIMKKEIVRVEDNYYIFQKKDIVTSGGDVIRVEACRPKHFDSPNAELDEETVLRIMKSMKPIKP